MQLVLLIFVTVHLGKGAAKNVGHIPLDVPMPRNCTESGTVGVPKVVQSRYLISTVVQLVHPRIFKDGGRKQE